MGSAGQPTEPEGTGRPVASVGSATDAASIDTVDLPETVETPAQLRALVRACRTADRGDRARLVQLARSPDPLVAGNAVRALGSLGLADAAVLGPLLDDERARVRHEAIVALGAGACRGGVARLSEVVGGDDPTARALAIRSLGRLADERARSLLVALVSSDRLTETDRAFARAALRETDSTSAPRRRR